MKIRMKKTFTQYIAATVATTAMLWSAASCSFLETDNSGKLGGFWQHTRSEQARGWNNAAIHIPL